MTFGRDLARWRTAAGLTQADLAERLNTSQQTIAKWETAKALPRAKRAPEIARLLNVLVDDVARSIVETAAAMERGEDRSGPDEKPKIPEGAALLSGRLADLTADDLRLINDMVDRLTRDRGNRP